MRKYWVLGILLALFLFSGWMGCKSESKPEKGSSSQDKTSLQSKRTSLFFDFEKTPKEKFQNLSSKTNLLAFSGSISSLLKGENAYSINILQPMEGLTDKIGDEVGFSFWIRPESEGFKATFVMQIVDKDGNKVFWKGQPVDNEVINAGSWNEYSGTFHLPHDKVDAGYTFIFYLWNRSNVKIFLDDVYIDFSENIKPRGRNLIFDDLENVKGKENEYKMTNKYAHSGKNASIMPGKDKYSVSILKKVKDLDYSDIGKVSLSAWIMPLDEKVEASYVFSIIDSTDNSNILWLEKTIKWDKFTSEEWSKVTAEFHIPKGKMDPRGIINVYFWNRGYSHLVVDDCYIAFGPSKQEKEDWAYCDLTKQPYQLSKQVNTPPYPSVNLVKTNRKLYFQNVNMLAAMRDGGEQVLIDRPYKKGRLFALDIENEKFFKLEDVEPELSEISLDLGLLADTYRSGNCTTSLTNLDGDNFKEVACLNNQDLTFYWSEFFMGDGLHADTVKVFHLPTENLSFGMHAKNKLVSGDFNGDGKKEIVVVSDNGHWGIVTRSKGNFVYQHGKTPMSVWNSATYNSTIVAGKFAGTEKYDKLLTVALSKVDSTDIYMLHSLNKSFNNLMAFYPEKNKYCGLYLGADSLKNLGEFMVVDWDCAPGEELLWINKKPRFDIKMLLFTEDGYEIKSQLGFTNYLKDQNPAYYENHLLVTAAFNDSLPLSLLVLSSNKLNKPDYPNKAEIYQFPLNQ